MTPPNNPVDPKGQLEAYCLVNGKLVKTPFDADKGDVVEKLPSYLSLAISEKLNQVIQASNQAILNQFVAQLTKHKKSYPVLQITVKNGKSVSEVKDVVSVPITELEAALEKET